MKSYRLNELIQCFLHSVATSNGFKCSTPPVKQPFMATSKMKISCPEVTKHTVNLKQLLFACYFQTQQRQTPPVCFERYILSFKLNTYCTHRFI